MATKSAKQPRVVGHDPTVVHEAPVTSVPVRWTLPPPVLGSESAQNGHFTKRLRKTVPARPARSRTAARTLAARVCAITWSVKHETHHQLVEHRIFFWRRYLRTQQSIHFIRSLWSIGWVQNHSKMRVRKARFLKFVNRHVRPCPPQNTLVYNV